MVDLRIGDLFPPDGHRYLSAAAIEDLRQLALSADMLGPVALTPREAMQIVCDLTNGIAEVEKLTARLVAAERVIEAVGQYRDARIALSFAELHNERALVKTGRYALERSFAEMVEAHRATFEDTAYDKSVAEHDKVEGESDG